MADLGFVGLGTMGGRIARRLLDAGHQVTGYNRTRSKAAWLLDAGMRWAGTDRPFRWAFSILDHATERPLRYRARAVYVTSK